VAGRFRAPVERLIEAVAPMFDRSAAAIEGLQVAAEHRGRGWNGFEHSADLVLGDMSVGFAAWGGDRQRGWSRVDINGQGCGWVADWDRAQECLGELPSWEPRRVDIALDTFKRESGHEAVLAAYRSGGFTTNGRPPKLTQIIGEDPKQGRTIYIGSRTGAKFLRCYEKGLQLAEGNDTLTHIDGVPVEDWYRVEAELKAKEGPLPVDIIDRRDQYFAGCYPYLQGLLSDVEPEILVNTRERAPQLNLAAALEQVRTQYGRTIFTALVAHHGDIGQVWDRIVGKEHNPALLAAGVLMVEHD
jgi:phage replication initiation protein